MLQASTASDVLNLLIGILSLSSVLPAILMNPGIQILTCASVVHLQELSRMANVLVQHQKRNGMLIQKYAAVHQILMVTTVRLALLQDSGIKAKTSVSVQARQLNGTHHHKNVSVQLESTGIPALNVQLQDIGT